MCMARLSMSMSGCSSYALCGVQKLQIMAHGKWHMAIDEVKIHYSCWWLVFGLRLYALLDLQVHRNNLYTTVDRVIICNWTLNPAWVQPRKLSRARQTTEGKSYFKKGMSSQSLTHHSWACSHRRNTPAAISPVAPHETVAITVHLWEIALFFLSPPVFKNLFSWRFEQTYVHNYIQYVLKYFSCSTEQFVLLLLSRWKYIIKL